MRQIAIILFLVTTAFPGFAQTPKPANATPDVSGKLNFHSETREEWVLSADQQTLTRATEAKARSTIMSSRAVFVRVP